MDEGGRVLLVYQSAELFDGLSRVLQSLGLSVTKVGTCGELRAQVWTGVEHLAAFVEEALPDGTWKDVKTAASRVPDPMPVIVVAPAVNIGEYIDSMENGASDYVVPPFLGTDIAHVLMSALGKTQTRGTWRPAVPRMNTQPC